MSSAAHCRATRSYSRSMVGRRSAFRTITLEAFADGLGVATQTPLPPLAARGFQMRVECIPTGEARHRHHEVAPRVTHQPLHLALIVALGRSPELGVEQIVTGQFGERPRPLPLRAAQGLRHRNLRVVLQYPRRHAAEVGEGFYMAFQKRLRRLGRKRDHEAVVRVRQVHRQIVRLALHAADHRLRLAEVRLRLPCRMRQRNEHLPPTQLRRPHIVLHNRLAARESVLFSETIEDPLRRVPLLGGTCLVLFDNRVDHANPRPQLRTLHRLLPLIPRWHRIRQHLPNRLARDPKLPRNPTLALPIHQHRSTYSPV